MAEKPEEFNRAIDEFLASRHVIPRMNVMKKDSEFSPRRRGNAEKRE